MQASMGIITGYCVYIGGYMVTQVLTPILAGPGFYLENLILLMPNILASGLIAALIGGIALPATLLVKKADFKMKERLYYPTTFGVSAICWFIVITSWILFAA
jgi:hypothetical protein